MTLTAHNMLIIKINKSLISTLISVFVRFNPEVFDRLPFSGFLVVKKPTLGAVVGTLGFRSLKHCLVY